MIEENSKTGRVEENVRIKKGSRIVFYNLGENLVLVKVMHYNKWLGRSYYWQEHPNGRDDKMSLRIGFSHLICYPIAYVMSQTAGLTDVKLVEEKENFFSYEVT